MLKNKGGFTLIELVMIIVILGILAAVAIPRFVDLGRDARSSACDGFVGGIRSGISLDWVAYLTNKTVAYNGGTPYGTGLSTYTEALETLEPGSTPPTALIGSGDLERRCDLNADGDGTDSGEIIYTLTISDAGPPPVPAYIIRTVN